MNIYINYISYPNSCNELENRIKDGPLDMEWILTHKNACWTVPKQTNIGDIIMYIHTKSAKENIKKIQKEIENFPNYKYLTKYLDNSLKFFNQYGGTLFAIAQVESNVETDYNNFDYTTHFSSRNFAKINNIYIFKNPISTKDFKNILDIRQHFSNVPLKKDSFQKIRDIIIKQNNVPQYFLDAEISAINKLSSKSNKMKFLDCYSVPKASEIRQEYEIDKNEIVFNISAENIENFIFTFINDEFIEPGFFILEVPLKKDEEDLLKNTNNTLFHKNVYYLDGQNKEFLINLFKENLIYFLKNGLISFGVASHITGDELFITKYNIGYIYSKDVSKYLNLFKQFDIPKVEKIKTAWHTFDPKNPGEVYGYNGKNNIYDFIKTMTPVGLYKAELRED